MRKNLFGNHSTVARRLLICSQRTGSIFFMTVIQKSFWQQLHSRKATLNQCQQLVGVLLCRFAFLTVFSFANCAVSICLDFMHGKQRDNSFGYQASLSCRCCTIQNRPLKTRKRAANTKKQPKNKQKIRKTTFLQ